MASLADAFAGIESSGNPLTWNTLPSGRRSRYRGLFQFGRDQERRYGITDANWTDPTVQRGAFEQHIGSLRGDLGRRLGRQPEDWELYFGHQQGPSGSHALLTAAPGTPAWQAIRRFYGSDAMAQQAISGNIPRRHPLFGRSPEAITAQDFAQMWRDRYGRQGVPGAPLGAPMVPPSLGAGMGAPPTAAPVSDTGQSWLSRIGSGLGSAFGIGSAEAQTPPVGGPPLSPDGYPTITLPPYGSTPPVTPPSAPPPVPVAPPVDLQSLSQLPSGLGLSGAAPPPMPPPGPPELPPDSPLRGTLGPPAPPPSPGGLPSVQQMLGSFMPAPPVPVAPPFGAPTVTPEPGSLGHPMGASELQPPGIDITRELAGAGLPQAQPPPVDADAIVRGAEGAAADRAGQPQPPGYIERLMQNPAFLAGLSILGTAPGGNWGPNAVQAMTGAQRAQREQTEYQRVQSRRTIQDRVWREAFGTNGQPNAEHPLLRGVPPEMAQTVFAMGPEEGLPALQRLAFSRAQQQEQIRLREANLAMFGLGPQQAPQASEEDQLRTRLGGLAEGTGSLPPVAPPSGLPGGPPQGGLPPVTPPPGSGVSIAPPSTGGRPPQAPSGGRAEPTVTIGNRTMPVSTARALATTLPDGARHVVEQAIASAERDAQVPEAIRTRALTADASYRTITGALGDYVRLVEQAGISGASWPGATRDAIVRSRTNLLLQLKEMHNLGVLNGPDLTLMENLIPDPTISVGNVVGQGSVAERARRAADQLRRELDRMRASALGAAGMQVPGASGAGEAAPGGGDGFSIRRLN